MKMPSAENANPTAAELKLRVVGVTAVQHFNRASKIDRTLRPGVWLPCAANRARVGVALLPILSSMQQSASSFGYEATPQTLFLNILKLFFNKNFYQKC